MEFIDKNLHFYLFFDVLTMLNDNKNYIKIDDRNMKFLKLCFKIKKILGLENSCINCSNFLLKILNNIKYINIKSDGKIDININIKNLGGKEHSKNKKLYKKYFYNLNLNNFNYHHIIPRSFSLGNKELRNKLNNYLNVIYIKEEKHVEIHQKRTYILQKITGKKIILKGPLNKKIILYNKKDVVYPANRIKQIYKFHKKLLTEIFFNI